MNKQLPQPGVLEKVLTGVVGALLLVAAFMFSLMILAVAVVVGLMIWGYFWWKTRKIRQAMREQSMREQPLRERPRDGHVIEGEASIVYETAEQEPSPPPRHPQP